MGGVEQSAAGVDEGGELLARFVLVGAVAPGHQPQAESRDRET
jgi:hypothetical protein